MDAIWVGIYVLVVAVLLIAGAYLGAVNGRYALTALCVGTLFMLVNPWLGIAVMLVLAVIFAINLGMREAVLTLIFTIVAYCAYIALATGLMILSDAAAL